MVRLEVHNNEGEVSAAYNLETEPGAQIILSGFHGSQVYEVTEFDTVLTVKFVGVTSVEDAPKEIKVEPITTEDGVTESDAQAMRRTMAEEEAKKNDEKNKKPEPKKEVHNEPVVKQEAKK
jgi:hypothetical protein